MDNQAEFCKIMNAHAGSHRVGDVFKDWCRGTALVLEKAVCKLSSDNEGAERCEKSFCDVAKLYKDYNKWSGEALAITIDFMNKSREEFLGHSLEALGMGNRNNGQFFTPNSVSRLMAEVTCDLKDHKRGEIVTLNDCACGASVTLIEGAEKMLRDGVPQRDIMIDAGDIDLLSCDISYIELTLLGYAAIVKHQNALTMETLSKPRLTLGWYLHGMPWRYRKGDAR